MTRFDLDWIGNQMTERLWCTACGTVTRDMICDCNRWPDGHEMKREPHFITYEGKMYRFDLDWIGNRYWPPRWWRRLVAWLGFWGCLVIGLGLFAISVFFAGLYVVGEIMEHFS